jgi:hypothetical protein
MLGNATRTILMKVTVWRLLRAKPVDAFPDADNVLSGWVPTTPALDLFAMMTSLAHGQAQLAKALVRVGWLWAMLSVLWLVLSILWSYPIFGKLTGWW